MKKFLEANPYSTRSQMIMILLGTMASLKGGNSKKSVLSLIEQSKWFDLRQEDRKPYPKTTTSEPRWHTAVAFRRKDCYEEDLFIRDGVRDSWSISKDGMNAYVVRKSEFASGKLDCARCYMWSPIFKKLMCDSYTTTDRDRDRPDNVYDDYFMDKILRKYLALADEFDQQPKKDSNCGES